MAAQESPLFCGVPMKLDREFRLESSLDERSERFEGGYSARTVIVRTGRREEWKGVISRILVGTDDDVWYLDTTVVWGSPTRRLKSGDHTRLGERVGKRLERDVNAGWCLCDNLARG